MAASGPGSKEDPQGRAGVPGGEWVNGEKQTQ